jgi:hypothetical protein
VAGRGERVPEEQPSSCAPREQGDAPRTPWHRTGEHRRPPPTRCPLGDLRSLPLVFWLLQIRVGVWWLGKLLLLEPRTGLAVLSGSGSARRRLHPGRLVVVGWGFAG